jgi:hypothetical protein
VHTPDSWGVEWWWWWWAVGIACPYFTARALAEDADIIFCPYNYLVDPGMYSHTCIVLSVWVSV